MSLLLRLCANLPRNPLHQIHNNNHQSSNKDEINSRICRISLEHGLHMARLWPVRLEPCEGEYWYLTREIGTGPGQRANPQKQLTLASGY